MASRWRLDGQNALVTGGTKGLGRAIVEELAELGCSVFTCCRNQGELDAAIAEWQAQGLRVAGCVADVSSAESRCALVEKAGAHFNSVCHIFVNNAGKNIRKATVDYTLAEFDDVMGTNFTPAFELSRLMHPLLKAAGGASVVFNSSVAGVVAISSGAPYAASKAAMNQLVRNLACEWAPDGIRVNAVAPWYINTPLAQPVLTDPVRLGQILQRTPAGRVGEPREVSGAVAFFCMQGASYITGETLCIDGAFTKNGNYFPPPP